VVVGGVDKSLQDLITETAIAVMIAATTARMRDAHKHLFAHFLSVRLNNSMSSCLSASVFVGSQLSGALSGERRTMIPANQKSGNKKPNLKRYMARVGGSATAEYDGKSEESA